MLYINSFYCIVNTSAAQTITRRDKMFAYSVFCYMPGMNTPEMVGSSGSFTNAQRSAVDYASEYGHAYIRQMETTDVTHYRKVHNGVKVSAQ